MNSFPLVSITIATFNVVEFVAHSLECLINQSYRNTEIICIDDGSTDGTLAILNKYADRGSKV